MSNRREVKKLLRETLETSILISASPAISADQVILDLLPKEAWDTLVSKHFSAMAMDRRLTRGAVRLLKGRTKGFDRDLLDLLEDKIIYTNVKCPDCGKNTYILDGRTVMCLSCYKVIPKEGEPDGTTGSGEEVQPVQAAAIEEMDLPTPDGG